MEDGVQCREVQGHPLWKKELEIWIHDGWSEAAEAEEEKDLGVWMHSSMKPTMQCEMAAKKANMALGMMLRSTSEQKRH